MYRFKFRFLLWGNRFGKQLLTIVDGISILVSAFTILVLIYQFGFNISHTVTKKIYDLNQLLLTLLVVTHTIRLFGQIANNQRLLLKQKALVISLLVYLYAMWMEPRGFAVPAFLFHHHTIIVLLALLSVYEFSKRGIQLLSKKVSPTYLFVLSFLLLIIAGTGLLMLPRSINQPITFLNALFTATSAVCVTGLTVVETATAYTPFGHFVILLLIQIGGIGVMTFTSFFALFFSGQSSIQNQLIIKDLVSAEGLNDILKTIGQIVAVTLIIEGIGAWVIFRSFLDNPHFTLDNAMFHAVFHSVSAFCNAGFSTFDGNLTVPWMQSNHTILYSIGLLIVLGGIGFPLQSNLIEWVRYQFRQTIGRLFRRHESIRFKSRMVTLNSRLIIYTTVILLVGGFFVLWFSEQNHSLKNLPLSDQIAHSFFWSVSPRTAGFNALGMETLSSFSILLLILLMWIGASPMSTGGGIKTTTFALAFLNLLAMIRNEDRIELNRRQIHWVSVHRAFAVISLSLLIIAISTALLHIFDPQVPLLSLLFETTSAISTVGLSLNLTAQLSEYSKAILILLMFIGRIGVLSFMMTLFTRNTFKGYIYPKEMVTT